MTPARQRKALENGALWVRPDATILIGDGPDLLDLLHRLSTQRLSDLQPGEHRATVLTTAKGRIIERLWVSHLGARGVLLVAGPGRAAAVLEHLRRYTFAETTGLRDASGEYTLLCARGPLAPDFPRGSTVLPHDVDSSQGRSCLVPAGEADALRAALEARFLDAGCVVLDRDEAERLRVSLGHPASGHELTDEHNPLEAGLREAVSFDKGCYVGQEVVARLDTYDKVSRELIGIRLPVEAAGSASAGGTGLFRGDKQVGYVTSVAGDRALGYVKRRDAGAGDEVALGSSAGPRATLQALPFEETA